GGVNALLPESIAVRWALAIGPEFHARFAATGRHYTYLLLDRPVRPALLHHRVGWYHRPLAIEAMRAGAAALLGKHDFSAFRAAECQAKSPVKTLDRIDIAREDDVIRFDLHADAFLQHMVRAIVAALPTFVTVVGLFVDPQPEAVNAALAAVPLDLLQFHGDERPELCASFGRPYIKAVPVRPEVDLLQYAARFDAAHGLLFDAFVAGLPGGTGTSFDWTQLPPQLTDPMSRRLILSGGLTPQNVAAAVRQLHPWAVD